MDKQIVFEDDHIRVIFMPGQSQQLIFSFGDLITRAKGLSINAEKSLMKYEYNTIGIMPKLKSWFPMSSMLAMYAAIEPILQRFSQRISYGGSMGGYASLKYSKMLGVSRIIAMVPQFSIDPKDVTDRRYTEFYDEQVNGQMRIDANDIAADADCILIYDPYFEADHEHYLKIQPLFENNRLHTLKLPFTGHDALAVLASSSLLHDLLEHPIDLTYFYQQIRAVKKNSKFYYRNVISRLLDQHYQSLGHILKSNDLQLDKTFFDAAVKQQITRTMLSNKQVTEQDLAKLGISVNLMPEQSSELETDGDCSLVFNLITQKIESYPQAVVHLNQKYLMRIVVKHTGLLSFDLNGEDYLLMMNDRGIMKLMKADDVCGGDISPIVVKKLSDGYALMYKHLYMHIDASGVGVFAETAIGEKEKFKKR